MDAYSIRKIVPRILIGVIAINLSIYICLAAISVSKIVANGAGTLITRPFIAGEDFDYTVGSTSAIGNALSGIAVAGTGYLVYKKGVPLLKSFTSTLFSKKDTTSSGASRDAATSGSREYLPFLIFFIILPIVILALSILVTLSILQGLIVLLTIMSPIAFALYILPNTETYFQKWWDLFKRSLLVYPIIAIIFAMSKVMSSIIFNANSGVVLGVITGFIVMFLPLFLIPFSFKLAGGAAGQIYGISKGVGDRLKNTGYVKGRRQDASERAGVQFKQGRVNAYRALKDQASTYDSSQGRWSKQNRAARRALSKQRVLGGYKQGGIERMESEINIAGKKLLRDISDNGDDAKHRAQTVNRQDADASWARDQEYRRLAAVGARNADQQARFDELQKTQDLDNVTRKAVTDSAGNQVGWSTGNALTRRVTDMNGNLKKTEYSTASGDNWVAQSDVVASEREFGHDVGMQQESWRYEMGKSIRNDQKASMDRRFGRAVETGKVDSREQIGIWKGAGFQQQGESLYLKHSGYDSDGNYKIESAKLRNESFQKKGSYPLSSFDERTIQELQNDFVSSGAQELQALKRKGVRTAADQARMDTLESSGAAVALQEHDSIARTLQSRMAAAGNPADGNQVAQGTTTGFAGSAGSGATNDALARYHAAVQPSELPGDPGRGVPPARPN